MGTTRPILPPKTSVCLPASACFCLPFPLQTSNTWCKAEKVALWHEKNAKLAGELTNANAALLVVALRVELETAKSNIVALRAELEAAKYRPPILTVAKSARQMAKGKPIPSPLIFDPLSSELASSPEQFMMELYEAFFLSSKRVQRHEREKEKQRERDMKREESSISISCIQVGQRNCKPHTSQSSMRFLGGLAGVPANPTDWLAMFKKMVDRRRLHGGSANIKKTTRRYLDKVNEGRGKDSMEE
jgi:hypothetical protein